jgi:hypothetical protein
MLVRFYSSETGEILMFADAAKSLLQAIGKETTARGVFTQAEMAGAAEALRQAVKATPAPQDDEEEDETGKKPPVVVFSQRAWPLIDMLDRTSRGGPKANIIWEAASDF